MVILINHDILILDVAVGNANLIEIVYARDNLEEYGSGHVFGKSCVLLYTLEKIT
jgi:hypothetical protein